MAQSLERQSCIQSVECRTHGWVDVKNRFAVNLRPRHRRYCVFEDGSLYFYKVRPEFTSNYLYMNPPIRSCNVKHVDGAKLYTSYRIHSFLITVEEDGHDRLLEIDPFTEESRDMWISQLVSSQGVSYAPNLSSEPTDMVKLGASIHRGLGNQTGENNCFLNVILQSLWHLRSMRYAILRLEIKTSSNSNQINVLSALKDLMEAYQDPKSGSLHPGSLRNSLSVLYASDKMFQSNSKADAEETLIALLNLMDQQCILKNETISSFSTSSSSITTTTSISQAIFGHDIQDRKVCNVCGAASDWELFSNLVFSVYVMEMKKESTSMEDMLRSLALNEEIELNNSSRCLKDSNCKGILLTQRTIRYFPQVFAISLIWNSGNASREQVESVLTLLGEELNLSKAFDSTSSSPLYSFRGFICYYGQHYFAFFYSTTNTEWLLFDDSQVIPAGSWKQVVTKCLKGRYQPVLVFYESPFNELSSTGARDRKVSCAMDYHLYDYSKGFPVKNIENINLSDSTLSQTIYPSSTLSSSSSSSQNSISSISHNSLISSSSDQPNPISTSSLGLQPRKNEIALGKDEYEVFFGEGGPLGIILQKVGDFLVVANFAIRENGLKYPAETSGKIHIMDIVVSCNGYQLWHYTRERAIQMIHSMSPPLLLRLRKPSAINRLKELGFDEIIARLALLRANGNVETAANICFEMTK